MAVGRPRGDKAPAVGNHDVGRAGQHHAGNAGDDRHHAPAPPVPRHRHNHSPPSEIISRPSGGSRGIAQTSPGSAETCCATQIVMSIPQPIGTSASRSRPNGINRQVTTPQGNVHIALNGTAMTLASGE